mmetsp:Transcript_573/g.1655  ORF Transcript_573/g.1655 Transcript_573/m.1655 type:complete len:335 (-) Transcript_573:110-1114(-)
MVRGNSSRKVKWPTHDDDDDDDDSGGVGPHCGGVTATREHPRTRGGAIASADRFVLTCLFLSVLLLVVFVIRLQGMMKLWCDSSRNDKTIEGAVKKLHRMKDESSKKLYLQAVSEITYCAYKHRVKPSQDKLTALRRDLARRRKETGVEIDLDLLDVRDHMKEGLESSKPKPKLTSDKKGQRPEQREHKKRANQNHRGGGKENKVTVKVKGCKRPHKAADDPVPAPPAKKKKSTLVGMMLQPAMEFWSKATKRAAPAGPPSQAPASDACSDEAGKVSPTAILDQELKAVAKRKKEQEDTKKRVLNALREKSKSTESDDAKVLAKLIKDVVEATG